MADGETSLAVLGGRACVGTKRVGGTVRFVGPVAFAEGIWVGLEIDEPSGKNNGTVKGVEYFNCADLHGLFLRPSSLFPEVSSPSEVIAEDVLQMDQAQHPKPTDTESSAQAAQQEGNVEQKEKEQGFQAKQSQDPAEASNSSNQTAPASGNASPPKKLQKSTTKRLPPSKAASKAKCQSSSTAEESSASAPLIVADQRSDEVKREDTKESGGASVSKPIEREGKLTNDRGDENLTERFSALESMTLQQMLAVQDRVASLETELSKRASNIVTDASANCAVHTEDQQQAMLDRMEERLRSRLAESREQLQMDQEKFGDRIRKLEIWSNGQHQSDDSKQISKLDTMCEDRLSILERRTDSLLEAQESSRRAESPQYDGRRNEEAPESESRLSAVEKRLQDCESRSSTAIEQARTAMVAIDTYEHELQHLRAQDQALEVRLDAASFQANSNSSVRTQLELEENRSPEGHMEYDFGSLGKRIDVQASALNGYIAESRKAVQLVQAQIESCKAKTQSCDEALGRGSNPELITLAEKKKDDVSKLDSERLQEIVWNLQEGFAECASGINTVRARVDAYHDELQNQTLKTQVSQQKLEARLAKRIDMTVPTPHFQGDAGHEQMQTQQTLEHMPHLEAHIDERVGALAATWQTVLPSANLLKQTQKLLDQMPKLEARVDACEKLSLSKTASGPTADRSPAPLANAFNPFSLLCV